MTKAAHTSLGQIGNTFYDCNVNEVGKESNQNLLQYLMSDPFTNTNYITYIAVFGIPPTFISF